MKLLVNGRENALSAEFMATTISLYTGLPSTIIVAGEGATYDLRSEVWMDEEQETYNPLMDRFVVGGIAVNGRSFLSLGLDEQTFSFPSSELRENALEATILHGPDAINGYHEGKLFLGVVTNVHNKIGLKHQWYYNDQIIYNGPNRCLIKIGEPGTYYCKVNLKDMEMVSTSVEVTLQEDTQSVCPQGKQRRVLTGNPQSVSLADLIKSGKVNLLRY